MKISSLLILILNLCQLCLAAENIAFLPPFKTFPILASLQKSFLRMPNQVVGTSFNFMHGVASGDPYDNSVILWTKVTPQDEKELKIKDIIVAKVSYKVCQDENCNQIVDQGHVETNSQVDFTVKIEAKNLEPKTTYYYQFFSGNHSSPLGTTKTVPSPDDEELSSLKIAVFSCSNFAVGYFNAYRNALRKSPDIAIHLGDYIYEDLKSGPRDKENAPRHLLYTLEDYRIRHALYKTDKDLQAAHRAVPWFVIWDDHESANDSWKNGSLSHNNQISPWEKRKAAAIQAYFEYMPIRQIDSSDEYRIYRSFQYGKLFDLIMLDTRLYGREHQREDVKNPNRTIMGFKQEQWFFDELSASKSREATWRLIANQVLFNQIPFLPQLIIGDSWEGYPANRQRVLDYIMQNDIQDTVILTGDIHLSLALDVSPSPYNRSYYTPTQGTVAVELVTTSVTSGLPLNKLGKLLHWFESSILKRIPQLFFLDLARRGYMILTVTKEQVTSEWWLSETQSILTINDDEDKKFTAIVKKGSNRIST